MQRFSQVGRLVMVGALVVTAGCPSKSPQKRDDVGPGGSSGTSRPSPPETQATLQAARDAETEGRLPDAMGLYRGFAEKNPRAAEAPDALLRAAEIAVKLDLPQDARRFYETLAMNHPGHPAANTAKIALASLDLKEGRTSEGLSGLRSAIEQVQDPRQRAQAAKDMGYALARTGENSAAVGALAIAESSTQDPADRAALQQALLDLVDGGLAAKEVLELREGMTAGTYTHRLLTLKLGRIYLHLGDDQRAKQELQAFLTADPQSPLAAHAQAALQGIEQRNLVSVKRLGVVLPLSGKHQQIGERLLAALKLGLESSVTEAIARGQTTPPPTPVEVIAVDDKGEGEDAAKAMDALVAEQKVMAVAGAITINGARGAALKAEALKVPLLTLARRDGLAEMGPFTFQISLTDERQAREVARLASEILGYKRVALLYPRLPKGVALINAFWDEFEARGGQIAGAESYDHDETTFSGPVRKLVGRHHLDARGEFIQCRQEAAKVEAAYKRQKALEGCKETLAPIVDFDALFIADFHGPVGLIAPALAFEDVFVGNDERALRSFKQTTGRQNVRMVQLLGTNAFNDKSLPQRGGKYVQGALFVDGFNPNDGRPETLAFLKAFNAATGKNADLRDAQAFDAGRMLGLVFAQNPQSRQEFQQKLAGVKDFPGVTGPTSFDAQGAAVTPLHVFTIRNESIIPATLEKKAGG